MLCAVVEAVDCRLKLKAKEGIARVFYCSVVDQKIIMLHCFIKKTEKTPNKELSVAKTRLKEVVSWEID